MRLARAATVAAVVCLLLPSSTSAQSKPLAGGFLSFNAGIQEGPQRLSVSVPVEIFGMSGTLDVDDHIVGAPLVDISGGFLGRVFGFGAGYSRAHVKDAHNLTASTTSFSAGSFQRVVTGITPDLEHGEDAIYVFAAANRAVSDHFHVMFAAGPTFFRVTQDVPDGISVSSPFGDILAVPVTSVKDSAIGLHVALDLTYMVARRVGIGGIVRYAWGSVELPNSTESMTLGGLNVGAGLRFKF